MDAILVNLEEEVCFSLLWYTSQPVPGKCDLLACYVKDVLQDVALYVSEIQGGRSRGSHCASTDRCDLASKYTISTRRIVAFLAGYGDKWWEPRWIAVGSRSSRALGQRGSGGSYRLMSSVLHHVSPHPEGRLLGPDGTFLEPRHPNCRRCLYTRDHRATKDFNSFIGRLLCIARPTWSARMVWPHEGALGRYL